MTTTAVARKKGLMARALEHSCVKPNVSNGFDESNFDNSISTTIPIKPLHSNGYKTYHNENNSPKLLLPSTQLQKSDLSDVVNDKFKNNYLSLKNDQALLLNPNLSIESPCSSPTSPTNPHPESFRKRRISHQASSDGLLPIKENEQANGEQFSSTQHLRSGFFRTIKKQYPKLGLGDLGLNNASANRKEKEEIVSNVNMSYERKSSTSDSSSESSKPEEEVPFMSSMAQKRLKELRKIDPKKVDVTTGLQWIRLELHEMREQDKALFLQLIKLHTTIKEIRNEMKFMEESYDSSLESIDGLASYWWPRCNEASVLPDFSSSDGAHLLNRKNRPMLRRGYSFNYSRPSQMVFPPNLSKISSGSLQSYPSSLSPTNSETTL